MKKTFFTIIICLQAALSFSQNVLIQPSGITPAGVPTGAIVLKQDATSMAGFTNAGKTLLNYTGWRGSIASNSLKMENPSWAWSSSISRLYLWGGTSFNYQTQTTSYIKSGVYYDYSTDNWTAMALPATLNGRANATVTSFTNTYKHKLLVWGGNASSTTPFGDGLIYDVDSDTWSNYGGTPPTARRDHTATTVTGNVCLIWGGRNSAGGINSGRKFDFSTMTWAASDISTLNAPAARYGHVSYNFKGGTLGSNDQILIWGGFDNTNTGLNTGGIYDADMNTWLTSTLATNLSSGANRPVFDTKVGTACDGRFYFVVFGGGNNIGSSLGGKYFEYDTETWKSLSTVGGPPALYKASAMIDASNRLVIWGGSTTSNGAANNNTVYTYDIANDKWLQAHEPQSGITPLASFYPIMVPYAQQVLVVTSSGDTGGGQKGAIFQPNTSYDYFLFKKD